ncbi:LOW QUALITY PROTEIN: F-actin-monooxygenase MICAL2 [Cygnus atratus]|uniref:LOW QUALITY PROTEIN: F-actin-monooxygenase MICAL2 n=1 Tax=Cygnus atratus TaxID=8868 RepID=UPI0021B7A0B1|nr:LOW QUALITY PROTEIN: F-actin-monooxygenase MICAL2 [Cygnus atratus]
MGENDDEKYSQAGQIFENFVQASTCKGTIQAFNILTRQLELDPLDNKNFYTKLKSRVTTWKAKALWNKLDKRASHKEYKRGKSCMNPKCLIIGGGPCGLRTAIELAFLGAKVVVVEKRDTFSRNNVLHLWPFTIHDLRGLGAKKFYGKFCAGSIDHISIRQLQLILFKVALILGVEIHVNLEFVKVLEPPEDQENQKIGWRAEFLPVDHPLSEYEFDVVIGADGRRNTLEGFRRKEFRGKLAIAITANFINRNTTAEAKVEEISGVAFIFNQKFFQDLKEETGIDLENIVYYKDSTHYFVMTAKKQSLLDKGVIINDYIDTELLLCGENVNQSNLLSYAREAADFATNYQLPSLDFAINHYGQPDVAMFDFTSMYASENAALVRERHRHQLLVALVGDSLLEPFWPMGTGCARGFLAAFDTVWMVRSWAQGKPPLEILAERESIYRLLPQTTPENINKNFDQYTIDPGTRYPNLNSSCVRPHQVRQLFVTNELQQCPLERVSSIRRSVNLSRHESDIRPNKLLTWCQKQTEGYRNVSVTDLTTSWKSGLALCAIIHRFRPDLIDFDALNEEDIVKNNQLAFDVAEREFGIPPVTTGKEVGSAGEPDKLSMVMYLSKFYELFRGTPLQAVDAGDKRNGENNDLSSAKSSNFIFNNYINLTLPRKRVPKVEGKTEENETNKRRRKGLFGVFEEASGFSSQATSAGKEQNDSKEGVNQNKVKSMATQLLAKFEENAPNTIFRRQKRAQTIANREFHKKNIKEKAAHLASMFGYMEFPKSKLPTKGLSHSQPPTPSCLLPHDSAAGCPPSSVGSTSPALPSRQMTVGKVSYAIGAMAEVLVNLYVNDHRPKPQIPPLELGSLRKEFPQSIGGSDICYFCKKRVYVMERLSAEGHFFHRECFKCEICSTTLRLGIYAFDVEEGKFYCKPHFAHCKMSNKHRKRRATLQVQGKEATDTRKKEEPKSTETTTLTTASSPEDRSPGILTSFFRGTLSWPLRVTRDLLDIPRRLSNWMHGFLHATNLHFRDNAYNYTYLYELLSLGVPFLCALLEVLTHMYREAELSLENVLEWAKKFYRVSAFREKVTLSRAEACILQIAWQDLFLESSSGAAPLHPGGLAQEPLIMVQRQRASWSATTWKNWSPSPEWTTVRVIPEEEMTEHNLLAIRVIVTSDASSSELESDFNGDSSNSEVGEGETSLLERPACPSPPRWWASLSRSPVVPEESHKTSKVADALQRANSFHSTALNKYQNWRRKIQTNFSLLSNKKPGLHWKESSASCQSDLGEDQFQTQKPPEVTRGHVQTYSSVSQRKEKVREISEDVHLYVPHCPFQSRARGSPRIPCGNGTLADEFLEPEDVDCDTGTCTGQSWNENKQNYTSESQGFNRNAKVLPSLRLKEKDEKNTRHPEEKFEQELKEAKKRLVLCTEQHPMLYESNGVDLGGTRLQHQNKGVLGISEEKNTDWRKGVFKQSRHLPLLFADDVPPALPVDMKGALKNPDTAAKAPTAGQPKSPLRLIANAIKRSILEPLTLSTEGLKQDSDSKSKASSELAYFSFPSTPGYSLSQRNSNNNRANNSQPQELKIGKQAGEYLGITCNSLSTPSNFSVSSEEISPSEYTKELFFPVYSPHSRPSRTTGIPHKSPCTRMEDVPGLLEKFTFKDTPPVAPRDDVFTCNEKYLLASSRESKNTPRDNLDDSIQSSSLGSLFDRLRSKVREREGNLLVSSLPFVRDRSAEDRLHFPSAANRHWQVCGHNSIPCPDIGFLMLVRWVLLEVLGEVSGLLSVPERNTAPELQSQGGGRCPRVTAGCFSSRPCNAFCSFILGCEHPTVRKEAAEYSTSSSDNEFELKPSLTHKAKMSLRRRRKLEKETKQMIKQEELKRLHKAQAVQRQLEELEERQRALEIFGVKLERELRGESDSGTQDETQMLHEWFELVLEKNKLMRYESELLIVAQELELEDHQSRLEQKLREKMAVDDSLKDEMDLNEEDEIFTEMMKVVEERDKLVSALEEQRVKEKAEDRHFESIILSRGYQLSGI